ncbi:MAG: hypothetical protein OJJ21_09275 [Ferrovibrio sp.]|uniref:hypothetical protein n=1 Tax=Ferrovibrio sp. TaxID=1917215 RepID=UPI00260C4AB2|nr:hypothetical protein [Ferrovibrio sp.]MCW0233775.1 hypothetical protein [Ferrovibrio sp.]
MSDFDVALTKQIGKLKDAISQLDFNLADARIEALLASVSASLVKGESFILEKYRPEIEKTYSGLLTKENPTNEDLVLRGQLRAITTLFSVGARQKAAVSVAKIPIRWEKVIETLFNANELLDNKTVAKRVGAADGTMARLLPEMRDAGIIAYETEWRRHLNKLTDEGRAIAAQLADRKRANAEKAKERQTTAMRPVNDSAGGRDIILSAIKRADLEAKGGVAPASDQQPAIRHLWSKTRRSQVGVPEELRSTVRSLASGNIEAIYQAGSPRHFSHDMPVSVAHQDKYVAVLFSNVAVLFHKADVDRAAGVEAIIKSIPWLSQAQGQK